MIVGGMDNVEMILDFFAFNYETHRFCRFVYFGNANIRIDLPGLCRLLIIYVDI